MSHHGKASVPSAPRASPALFPGASTVYVQMAYLFEHLLDPQIIPIEEAQPMDIVGAQAATLTWLDELGAVTHDAPNATTAALARQAFAAVTTPDADPLQAKNAILALRAPPAVRHLAGMLTQYDWDFVQHAGEIRSFVVAKLLQHAEAKDPKVSLAALKQLGTVTEVGLFTERVEVTKKSAETTDIAERLRARLQALLPKSDSESSPLTISDAIEKAVVPGAGSASREEVHVDPPAPFVATDRREPGEEDNYRAGAAHRMPPEGA